MTASSSPAQELKHKRPKVLLPSHKNIAFPAKFYIKSEQVFMNLNVGTYPILSRFTNLIHIYKFI